MFARRRESGQASVELVAAIPVVLGLLFVVAQLTIAGYGLWTGAAGARAGARADLVGGDAARAARSAVPQLLDREVREHAGKVTVTVRPPGLRPVPLQAQASLEGDG